MHLIVSLDGNIAVKSFEGNKTVYYSEGNKTVERSTVIARGEVKSPETLGRILQQGRLVKGLTQRDLADKLDTDQKYIWALESGKSTIVLERIFEIMRETGIRMYMEVDGSVGSSVTDPTGGRRG